MIWPETAKVYFFLKANFNFIILFKLIITKLQLTLVLNFFSSWSKTAIVGVDNPATEMFITPATEILTSNDRREFHNIKTYKKRETSHCEGIIKNYETWIKKRCMEKVLERNER